jgi:LysR family nitrogen assimilation transcriptional regulator
MAEGLQKRKWRHEGARRAMEIKQLKYFLTVVEFGNITRAAESLHIAQPALSYHILNLEQELKTKLLNRSVHGVTPTSTGEVLYRHAKGVLRHIEDIRVAVDHESASPSGRVTIGIPGSTARILAIPLLKEARIFPGILLEIVERQSGELAALVAQGRLDIAVTVDAQSPGGVTILPLVNEELYAILPATEAKLSDSMTLADLAGYPLVLPSVPNLTRIKLDLAFLEANLSYKLLAEVSTTDLMIRIVESGAACTVLPWSAVSEEIRSNRLYAARMKNPTLKRELSLCVSEAVPLTQAAQVVRDLIVSTIPGLLTEGRWKKANQA